MSSDAGQPPAAVEWLAVAVAAERRPRVQPSHGFDSKEKRLRSQFI